MGEYEMYVCLQLILHLNNGEKITYSRDARPDYMGYFFISKYELLKITTIADLIGILEEGELLHLSDGDMIDIDEFCKYLIKNNGKDFVPDENEKWYSFKNVQGVSVGMSGEELVEFWDAYQENQKSKKAFIEKIKTLPPGSADQIIIKKTYDDFGMGMDDVYEDEEYTKRLSV